MIPYCAVGCPEKRTNERQEITQWAGGDIIDDFIIDKVCAKLKTSTDTIQQVAYEFGFLSQAHFAKFFRKMKGESPSDYRKNI